MNIQPGVIGVDTVDFFADLHGNILVLQLMYTRMCIVNHSNNMISNCVTCMHYACTHIT